MTNSIMASATNKDDFLGLRSVTQHKQGSEKKLAVVNLEAVSKAVRRHNKLSHRGVHVSSSYNEEVHAALRAKKAKELLDERWATARAGNIVML
jgi:hypothetical protein